MKLAAGDMEDGVFTNPAAGQPLPHRMKMGQRRLVAPHVLGGNHKIEGIGQQVPAALEEIIVDIGEHAEDPSLSLQLGECLHRVAERRPCARRGSKGVRVLLRHGEVRFFTESAERTHQN